MKVLNYKDIVTTNEDDFLYLRIINLLNQIKVAQGGTALDATLHRHPLILNYCKAKQLSIIDKLQNDYFLENGALDIDFIRLDNSRRTRNFSNVD